MRIALYALNLLCLSILFRTAKSKLTQQQRFAKNYKKLPISLPRCSSGSGRYLGLVKFDENEESQRYTDHDFLHSVEVSFNAPEVGENDQFGLTDYCQAICAREYGCNTVRVAEYVNSCIIVYDCISDDIGRKLKSVPNPEFLIRVINPFKLELGSTWKNMWDYAHHNWPGSTNEQQYTTVMYQDPEQTLFGQVKMEKNAPEFNGPLLRQWQNDTKVQNGISVLPSWMIPTPWSRKFNIMQPVEFLGGCSGSMLQLKIPNVASKVISPMMVSEPPIPYKDPNLNKKCQWYGYNDIPSARGATDNFHTAEVSCADEDNAQHSGNIYVQEIQCIRFTFLYTSGESFWQSRASYACNSVPHCFWDTENKQCYQTQFEPIYGDMLPFADFGSGKKFYHKKLAGTTLAWYRESNRHACELRCAQNYKCQALSFYRLYTPPEGNCQLFSNVNTNTTDHKVDGKTYDKLLVNVDKYGHLDSKSRINALAVENTWQIIHLVKVGRYKQYQRGHATAFKYVKGPALAWFYADDQFQCQYYCSMYEKCFGVTYSSVTFSKKYGNCKLLQVTEQKSIEFAPSIVLWNFHFFKDSTYEDVSKQVVELLTRKPHQAFVLEKHKTRNIEVCADKCTKHYNCRGFSINAMSDFVYECILLSSCVDMYGLENMKDNFDDYTVKADNSSKWKHFKKVSGYYYSSTDGCSEKKIEGEEDDEDIDETEPETDAVPPGVIAMIVIVCVLFVGYLTKTCLCRKKGYEMVQAENRSNNWADQSNEDPWAAQRKAAPFISIQRDNDNDDDGRF